MAHLETSYRRLESTSEDESPVDEQAYLVQVADGNKTRWHHIEDLDAFFTRVYQYHQNHGFGCMMLQQCFELFQFVFVVGFAAFLFRCVKYDVLFANGHQFNDTKVTMADAVLLGRSCSQSIGRSPLLVIFLLIAALFWAVRAVRVLYNFFRLSEIKAFYSTALHIKPNDLDNTTWHEVQRRLMMVQADQQMCIHKQELTELDIYNRILRFKNYMIAMVNKEVLPIRYKVPIIGDSVFFTQGLKFNMELILFWGPWSLFANNYNLKEEYKRRSSREELIQRLENQIWWAGVVNLLLSPIILVWQVLYSFFSYAEILRREPGSFGARRWSMYSRLYLRHFNELSHEFQARQNRGYNPSTKYMDSFNSPVMTIFAKNAAFFVGSLLAVLLVLTIWDEDVLRVEHVLTTITLCTIIITICKSFIPDENAVSCPEQLMKKVLSQIHYVPGSWHGRAHTYEVRDQFAQLFQYKAVYILEEVLSPLITPFILMFPMKRRASRMIDFFRNFTVDIAGVGDVCSFAQMDVRRHGDPKWNVTSDPQPPKQPEFRAMGGKTELSLMHFAITNPKWKPADGEDEFLNNLKERAHHDALMLSRNEAVQNPLLTSLQSLGSIGIPQVSFLQQPALNMMSTMAPRQTNATQEESIMEQSVRPSSLTYEESMMTSSAFPRQQADVKQPRQHRPRLRGRTQNEGSMEESGLGLISSVIAGQQGIPLNHAYQSSLPTQRSMFSSMLGGNAFGRGLGADLSEQAMTELAPMEMGFSALYLHELHHSKLIRADREANWESIAEERRNDSYHSNEGNMAGTVSMASGSGGYSAPHHPSNQNYNTLNPTKAQPGVGVDLHTIGQGNPPPFMSHGGVNVGTPPRTSFSDTTLQIPPRSQGERSTESVLNERGIDLGSDSDEAPQEFHLPETEEQNDPHLQDLPSLGLPPTYSNDQHQSGGYQPPEV